ncbi:hypothetical protein Tco_0442728 [Tanacetum coccineum]
MMKSGVGFFGVLIESVEPTNGHKNVRIFRTRALAIVLRTIEFTWCIFQKYMTKRATGSGPTDNNPKITKGFQAKGSKPVNKCSIAVVVPELKPQVFEDKWFAHAVKERTLDNLITEILIWLLDERVPRMHDGSQLLKVLNLLMLKILDLQSTIDKVDLDHILQIIHVYLQELGIDEIRRRVGARENDVHMLKTLLYELCKLCGTAIKGHLSMVPIDMEPQPIILAYIDLNLQRELAPINNNNNIPNSAGARLTYLLYYKTQAELYLRLQRNISEEEIAGLKQTFEMIDADIGHIT